VVTRWIALLRGVNVGGGNKIAMPVLRVSCEGCGFERVSTYIQSGNVVFDATGDEASVTASLRKLLAEEHGLKVPVVVRTAKEMDRLADSHPGLKAGVDPRYLHIVFLDKKETGGLFSLIVRRTPEGWRIVHDHTSLGEPDGGGS